MSDTMVENIVSDILTLKKNEEGKGCIKLDMHGLFSYQRSYYY